MPRMTTMSEHRNDMMDSRSITRLLIDWSQGDHGALEELTPHVHRELHALARTYLGRGRRNHTLQPTELIDELYVRLMGQSQRVHWESRSHFFGIAARLMRLVLVDYARARNAAKRGGGLETVTLDEMAVISPFRTQTYWKWIKR